MSQPNDGDPPFHFVWSRAIQDSHLKPTATLVAYAFCQFIGVDKRNPPDTVQLSLSELQRITRLSRDAANRGTRNLREAGWLTPVTPAAQHRSVLYHAVIPLRQQYVSHTAEQSVTRTGDDSSGMPADISSTPPDTISTAAVPQKKRTKNDQDVPSLF